jgi:hypothetical protein
MHERIKSKGGIQNPKIWWLEEASEKSIKSLSGCLKTLKHERIRMKNLI